MNTRSMAAVCYCVCFLLGVYFALDAPIQVQVATAYTTQIRPSHLQTQTWEPSVLVGKPTTTTTTTTSPTPIPSLLHKKNKKHNININRTTKEVAPMKKKEIATSMSSMWERLAEIKAADEIIEGTVLSVNAGGAIVQITSKDHHGIVKAFLPKSQVSMKSHTARRTELIGTVLPFKIVSIADYSYGSKHRRLVVSHKRAVAAQQQLWKTGDVVHDGVVTAITSYGAFISFHKGRRQGLLHKNNISHNDWKLVRTKNEDGYLIDECFRNDWETNKVLLKVGSQVKCLITRITDEGGRISLSTEALEPEPGDMLCNPNLVFEKAAETATKYNDRLELEDFIMNEIATEIATSTITNTLLPSSSSTTFLTMNHNKNTNEHHLLRP